MALGVVDGLEVVEVEEDERQRHAGAPRALQLAGDVLVEGAMVAQAGERIGDRHLGQALDLGEDGGIQAAAVAHDDRPEERDEQQRNEHRDRDGPVGAHLVAAQRGAVGEGRCARGGSLAVDDVREDAEHGVDRQWSNHRTRSRSFSSTALNSAWLALW